MATTNNALGGVLRLSNENFETLKTTGSVIVDGVTYTYQPEKFIYVTPDDEEETPSGESIYDDNGNARIESAGGGFSAYTNETGRVGTNIKAGNEYPNSFGLSPFNVQVVNNNSNLAMIPGLTTDSVGVALSATETVAQSGVSFVQSQSEMIAFFAKPDSNGNHICGILSPDMSVKVYPSLDAVGTDQYFDIVGTFELMGDYVMNMGQGLKSTTYDDTTLAEHIDEILGHVNVENGGSLISVGFKVGATANITATAKNIQYNTDGTVALSDASVTPFTAGDFVQANLEHIDANKTGVYLRCATNPISNGMIELFKDTGTTRVQFNNNQITINAGNGLPLMTFYNNVDIANMPLEHLVITYHS